MTPQLKNHRPLRPLSGAALLALLGLGLLLPGRAAQAQALPSLSIGAGTSLTLGSGTSLTIPGNLTATGTNATIDNNGTVTLAGNFNANNGRIGPGTGPYHFVGTAQQTLDAGGQRLPTWDVQNPGGVKLLTTVYAQSVSLLPAGAGQHSHVFATGGDLHLDPGGSLGGGGTNGWVVTNGGKLYRYVPNSGQYPIGRTAATYQPFSLSRTIGGGSTGVQFGVSVGALACSDAGPKVVNDQWNVTTIFSGGTATPPAGDSVLVTPTWPGSDESPTFARNSSAVGKCVLSSIPAKNFGPASGSDPYSRTSGRFALNGPTTGAFGGGFVVVSSGSPLPVELTSFTATRREANAVLRWTTASERASDYFAVEASPDGQAFRALGRVASQGNSTSPQAYTYTDTNLLQYGVGLVYYRLRQVDQDGTASYSPVRTVAVPALPVTLALRAWPNPFDTQLTLSIAAPAGPFSLALYNAVGQRLWQRTAVASGGAQEVAVPEATRLPSGVYVLRLEQNGQSRLLKIVRQ